MTPFKLTYLHYNGQGRRIQRNLIYIGGWNIRGFDGSGSAGLNDLFCRDAFRLLVEPDPLAAASAAPAPVPAAAPAAGRP